MTIGIIGAMEVEVDAIREQLERCEIRTVSGIDYYAGTLYGKRAVVAQCGPGKVNAAVAAQTMLLLYQPDLILNTGVAGGLHPDMQVLDLAIAQSVCQHDLDTTGLGDPPGLIPQLGTVYMECDASACRLLRQCAEQMGHTRIFTGAVATGDQFVASNMRREQIKAQFGAIAAEMEGGSIGQVCTLAHVPFAVARVISDAADDAGGMSYQQFVRRAAKACADLVLEFVKVSR